MSAPILAFAPGVWGWPDFAGSPRYHLWSLAGAGWPVIYVEPPIRFRARSGLWKAPDRPFHVLSPGRVAPFALRAVTNPFLANVWRAACSRQLVSRALRACRELNATPGYYWFGAPWHGSLVDILPAGPRMLYHVYDELPESPAFSAMQRQLLWKWECELMKQCKLVLCSSEPQLLKRQPHCNRALLLQNAVDDKWLAISGDPPKSALPLLEQMRSIPHPRLVYGGVADHRLESEIFLEILKAMPDAHVIFLGKKDSSLDGKLARFLTSRLHFFGNIPYGAFPWLYREADALLIAHKSSPFTNAMYPEKLNEYLASGKPIVSVDMPEVRRIAAEGSENDLIRIASNPSTYVEAIREALADLSESRAAARRAIAANHTWQSELGVILRAIA